MYGDRIWIRTSAPTLGQHNDEVFRELGVDEAKRGRLRQLRVIGDELVGA